MCKQWWNREWRDRLFAFAAALTKRRALKIPLGEGQSLAVSMAPMNFIGPWSSLEDTDPGLDETRDIELVEDAEPEDGDETD